MTSSTASTAIVTDSTSDIPLDEAQSLNIAVVPALLTLDGQTHIDGQGLSRDDFYNLMPTLEQPPTTAAPSPLAFTKEYERLIRVGFEKVLSIHVSPKLSTLITSATQAAKEFGDRVRIFDSGQVSLGLGFQALEAAGAARAGATFEEVLAFARAARERVRTIAMVDTLEYLRRSGRVSWLQSGLGNLLEVKLLLEIIDGVVERLGQVRTRRKALSALVEHAQTWGPLKRLAIPHSAARAKALEFSNRVGHLCPSPPWIIDVTTVIGAHVGPAAIGVIGLQV